MSTSGWAEENQISEINVTPLADVSLTLLIVMMILTPMVMQAMITVTVAKATSSPAARKAEISPVTITVDISEKIIFLNNELIEDDLVFAEKFASLLAGTKEPAVLVTVSPKALHGRVVEVLDLAKMNGASKLSIVPRKKI